MRILGFVIALLLLPLVAMAETDVSNSKDYPVLKRFPASYIVQYKQAVSRDYRQVLGVLEKINGVLRAEKEQRLSGQLTQITYRIPENHTPQEAFDYLYSQIKAKGGTELFRCTGRECGSSNQWANNIFRYFRLYGVDNSQSYAAFELNGSYLSLYSVRRGNKRVYLRLDVLENNVSKETPGTAPKSQMSWEVQDNDAGVKQLKAFLSSSPNKVIWIISFDNTAGSKKQQLQRSEQRLVELRTKLAAAGADLERIFIHAVGAFSNTEENEPETKLMVYSEDIGQ